MQTLINLLGIILFLIGAFLAFVALNVMAEKLVKEAGNYYTTFKWWHIVIIGLIGDVLGFLGWHMIH